MRKFYFLPLILISFHVAAQTIDQNDLPFAGLAWTSGVDTNYADPIPPGGAMQNWNFSSLQYSNVDTTGFQDAVGTPYAATFPGANLASHRAGTADWTYFNSSSTGFYINGFVSPALSAVIVPQQMYVPVPFSYGDQHTDISRVVVDTTYLTFPAQVILNFHADFHADGYGSLTTPIATYPSTLRIRETMLETDSLMIDYLGTGNYVLAGSQQSQKNYFRWYQHGATANYILGIDADSLGNFATRSDYVIQWIVLGTHEIKNSSLVAYPNPSNSHLTFDNGQNEIDAIEILNALGEKVYNFVAGTQQANTVNGRSKVHIDTGDWEEGIYFYHLVSGEESLMGRFIIVH